jgi:4-amino-4-deoxy-L-arabinose transferase-like glycosyltransferase
VRRIPWTQALLALPLAAMLALAVWVRISSLETLPEVDGDEAWYGIQAAHFLSGKPYTFLTPNSNPVNPFHTGTILLFQALGVPPRLWLLRLPSVLGGLLAVGLTYWLGRRALDRQSAIVAACLMAVLPVSVIWSRTGYDGSQLLLFAMLATIAALQANRVGLGLASVCAFLAHPTSLFLAPMLGALYLWNEPSRRPGVTAAQRRRRLIAAAVAGVVVLLLGVWVLQKPVIQNHYRFYKLGLANHHDLGEFWAWFGRLFLIVGREPRPQHDRLFWLVVLPLTVAGSIGLARHRHWDRLLLVAGVIVGALGIAVVGGTTILQPGMTRYGLYLVAPACLAAGCLVQVLLARGDSRASRLVRHAQYAGLLGIGWLLLFSYRMETVTVGRITDGQPRANADTIWTFSGGEPIPPQRVIQAVLDDIARGGPGPLPRVVVADDWQTYQTLRYLSLGRRSLDVIWFHELFKARPDAVPLLGEIIRQGGYAVSPPDGPTDRLVRAQIPAENLATHEVTRYGQPSVVLLRQPPPPALADGPRPDRR